MAHADDPRGPAAAFNDRNHLAEQVGGSTGLDDRYREIVVNDAEVDRLDERDTALDAFTALEQREFPNTESLVLLRFY